VIPNGEDEMRVDTPAHMAEGSRNVGEPGYAETFFKDTTKPDGDACRPDGTLKNASEISWLNSPSDDNNIHMSDLAESQPDQEKNGHTLKRSLPCDEDEPTEDEDDSDNALKAKVS
jgi:hypothetical protein